MSGTTAMYRQLIADMRDAAACTGRFDGLAARDDQESRAMLARGTTALEHVAACMDEWLGLGPVTRLCEPR